MKEPEIYLPAVIILSCMSSETFWFIMLLKKLKSHSLSLLMQPLVSPALAQTREKECSKA